MSKGPYPLIHLPFDPKYASEAANFKGETFNPHLWHSGEEVPGYTGTWNAIGEGFVGCGPQWDRPVELRPPDAQAYNPIPTFSNFQSSARPLAPWQRELQARHQRNEAFAEPLRARYLSNRSPHLAKNMPTIPGYINPSDYR